MNNQIYKLKNWTIYANLIFLTFASRAIAYPSTNIYQPENNPTSLISQLLAQTDSIAQITSIRLEEQIDNELLIILETANNELLQSSSTRRNRALIVNIPNAQLSLREGDSFSQENPFPGVASIRVTSSPEINGVQIEITGTNKPPEADSIASEQGLTLSVIPDETSIEIIVTAQKTPESVQEVPISITVFDEQDIEDRDIDSFQGIANNTPNFSFFTRGNSRLFAIYSVRGITNLSFASRDAVGFYVDDVPYDYGGFLDLDLIDLQRVEVLRGPQSTLYGRSSLGGVVNVISRKPSNEVEFRSITSYGSFDKFNVQASVNYPLIQDKLFLRLSGSYESQSGYNFNTFLEQNADTATGRTGRMQLLWTPSSEWEIGLNTSFGDYRNQVAPIVLLDQPERFQAAQDFQDFNNLATNAQSLRIAYRDPNLRVTSITTRRFSSQDAAIDLDYTPADGRVEFFNYDSTVWSQEVRLQSPETTQPFQWLLGGYFESLNFQNRSRLQYGVDALRLGSRFPQGAEITVSELNNTNVAAFGQLSYQPIEALKLTAGLRYESINSKLESYERIFTPADGSNSIPVRSFQGIEQDGTALLPRFVVEYNLNPNVMVYSSITQGYRPPGANFSPSSEVTATYQAETSWNYELGFKSTWFNNRLLFNSSIFNNLVDNFQFVQFQAGRLSIANANVNITGAEVEIKATPINGLDFNAGLGITSAKFDGNNFSGNQVTYTPEFTYNLGVQYRSLSGIFGRVEMSGFGPIYFNDANTFKQDSFAIVNARLGYEASNYGIYLFANNIFDTAYLTQVLPATPARGFYGAPATIGIEFRSRF